MYRDMAGHSSLRRWQTSGQDSATSSMFVEHARAPELTCGAAMLVREGPMMSKVCDAPGMFIASLTVITPCTWVVLPNAEDMTGREQAVIVSI